MRRAEACVRWGVDARIGDGSAGDSLTPRAVNGLECVLGFLGRHAVVTETLDPERAVASGKADFVQARQIVQLL